MKKLILALLMICMPIMAEIKDMPEIDIIRKVTDDTWKAGLTQAFQSCKSKVNFAILEAAQKGEYTVLVELDYAPGYTSEAIVGYLKNSGYEAIALEVGGLPGTSYHSFIQVSWFNKEK